MLKKVLIILVLIPICAFSQHTIKGSIIPNQGYKNAILYKITPIQLQYVAHAPIDESGDFNIKLDSIVTSGMYKLVYAAPQEEYSFDIIYNGKEDISFKYNSEVGIIYQESNENKLVESYTSSMSVVNEELGKYFTEKRTDSLALVSIFSKQKIIQSEFELDAKETIAFHFIRANKPYIPEDYEGYDMYVKNLEKHFFDFVDFNNEILQSSNFLIEKSINYVFGITSESEDEVTTYKNNIDAVCLAMKDTEITIKKRILEVLWQQMVDATYDDVANYIADNYLIDITKKTNDMSLISRMELFKSLSHGSIAPDFELNTKTKSSKKLSELDTSEYYVVLFWSSTCGHCLKEIPLLDKYLESMEKGKLEIVAVGLESESESWTKEILNYPYFTHVLGLGKWDNPIGNSYNVQATPTYYLLDKNKKIVLKPYDFEALKVFLEENK